MPAFRRFFPLCLIFALALLAPLAFAQDIVDTVADHWLTFVQEGDTLRLPYYASHDLGTPQPDLVRVVVIVHGTLRNADSYFAVMQDAAALAGTAGDSTLIIAPQFLTADDVAHYELDPRTLCWSYDGWRQGDQSLVGAGGGLSSFAVADSLLVLAAHLCPNLREAVVTGHSAGGQFANRHAASSPVPDLLREEFGVHYRSVIANPSTYVYFTPERWVRGTAYEFAAPSAQDTTDCPEWDDYKYGLQNPNPYFTLPADTVLARYSRRHVVHLLGMEDTNPYDIYLDRACPAMFQGDYRLERGLVYWHYLQRLFGDQLSPQQKIALVPWAGHHHYEMYPSDCGLYHVFDVGECEEPNLEPEFVEEPITFAPTFASHALAWADYDGDGWEDLLIAGAGGGNHLLHNDGAGAFVEVTPPELQVPGFVLSPAWADWDDDGLSDLALINWNFPSQMLHNDGNGAFTDVAPAVLRVSSPTTAADWADYDGDGDLDLFVGRGDNVGDLLLRNDGPAGFVDASEVLGGLAGDTRGAAWGDLDGDGDPDLVLARNGKLALLRKDGGTFTDLSDSLTAHAAGYSSVALGDYDNDGDLDLYFGVRDGRNLLLRNDGGFSFVDVTQGAEGSNRDTRSAGFADYDGDGWLDLYLANRNGADQLLRNSGDGRFGDATRAPLGATGQCWGAGWADPDRDGDVDLYVGVRDGEDHYYLNQATRGRHWLHVDLAQPAANRRAVGARIRCVAGALRQIREVGCDETYLAQGSLTAEFGLGAYTQVDTLEVRWPDGTVTVVTHLPADQRLLIDRQESTGNHGDIPLARAPLLLPPWPNPCNPVSNLAFDLPRAATVSLAIYDLAGRRLRTLVAGEALAGGRHQRTWDGRDDSGRAVAAGVYRARLAGGGGASMQSIVLIR